MFDDIKLIQNVNFREQEMGIISGIFLFFLYY